MNFFIHGWVSLCINWVSPFLCITFIGFICNEILDLRIYKTNVMGTLNMLGLAKRIGARFLLTSTSEVYGDPLEHPQKETYWGNVNPIGTSLISNKLLLFLAGTLFKCSRHCGASHL